MAEEQSPSRRVKKEAQNLWDDLWESMEHDPLDEYAPSQYFVCSMRSSGNALPTAADIEVRTAHLGHEAVIDTEREIRNVLLTILAGVKVRCDQRNIEWTDVMDLTNGILRDTVRGLQKEAQEQEKSFNWGKGLQWVPVLGSVFRSAITATLLETKSSRAHTATDQKRCQLIEEAISVYKKMALTGQKEE